MSNYISKAEAINTILGDMQNGESNMEKIFNTALRKAASAIETIPAADVVPVVHAEWVMTEFVSEDTGIWWSWHCSNCGDTYDGLGKLDARKHKYCHHCGARMDVEQEKCEAQKRDLENARRNMEKAIATPVFDVTRWQYPQLTKEAKQDATD